MKDRAAFTRAMDELQAAMIVMPSEVFYQPKFTYIWTLGVGRFPDALRRRVSRETALREIARCFLAGAGLTIPGELARVTGLSRPEAGRGNRALVAEGYATMLAPGWYQLAPSTITDDARCRPTRRPRGGLALRRRPFRRRLPFGGLGLHVIGEFLAPRLAVPLFVGLRRDLPLDQERGELATLGRDLKGMVT